MLISGEDVVGRDMDHLDCLRTQDGQRVGVDFHGCGLVLFGFIDIGIGSTVNDEIDGIDSHKRGDSRLVREEREKLTSRPRDPRKVGAPVEGACFLAVEIKGGDYCASNFYCIPAGNNRYKWDQSDWWGIPLLDYAPLTFVCQLPKAPLSMETKRTESGYAVTLTNQADVLAYQNILKALDAQGNLIPGALWSDNFVTLLPGESRTVQCVLPEGVEPARIGLDGWNGQIEK